MRFTHSGMPVKSIDVPDVEATAVDSTLGDSVPVAAASVMVFKPAIAGASIVTVPLVSPERISLLIGLPNVNQTRP